MTWVRASHRVAVKFTGTVIGAAVLLALAAAPNVLATPDADQAEPHRLPAWHLQVQDGGGQPAPRPRHLASSATRAT